MKNAHAESAEPTGKTVATAAGEAVWGGHRVSLPLHTGGTHRRHGRRWVSGLALIVVALAGHASAREGSAGRAGALFQMGLGARAKAMGGAQVGVADDVYAVFYNPAGLSFLSRPAVTATGMALSLDRRANFVGFATPLPPTAAVAVGWLNAGVGDIDRRDFSGNRVGSLDNAENAVFVAFSNRVTPWLAFGLTGKFLHQKLFTVSASGFGFDAGVYALPVDRLTVGFVVKDIRSAYDWDTGDIFQQGSSNNQQFPIMTALGAAYRLARYDVLLAADLVKDSRGDTVLHVGAEYAVGSRYRFRAGVHESDIAGGIGIGVPIGNRLLGLDYTVESVDNDTQLSQVVSIAFQF